MLEKYNLILELLTQTCPVSKRTVRIFFLPQEQVLILRFVSEQALDFLTKIPMSSSDYVPLVTELFQKEPTRCCLIQQALAPFDLDQEQLFDCYHEKIDPQSLKQDLVAHYQQLKKQANQLDNQEKRQLNDYLIRSFSRSENAQKDMARFAVVIQKIQQLRYLLLSDDPLVKTTYSELAKSAREIIARYQKQKRG